MLRNKHHHHVSECAAGQTGCVHSADGCYCNTCVTGVAEEVLPLP